MRRRDLLHLIAVGSAVGIAAACASPSPGANGSSSQATSAAPTQQSVVAPTASGTSAPAAAPTSAATQAPTPTKGGTLRLGIPSDITALDGHLIAAPATDTLWQIFDRLTDYNASLEPQPMLAESWSVNADGTQLTLKLRQGVKFHSGRDFTSADVAWNLDRVKDPKVGAGILAGYRRPLTSVETPDASTVVLKSDRPWPAAFDFFQLFNIIDKDTMNGSTPGQTAGGTGPFMLAEWVQGDHLSLMRNPNYWQSSKPYLDEILAAVSPDAQANLLRFESGATDVCDSPPLVDTVRMMTDSSVDVLVSQNPSVFLSFFFNTTLPPFDRKEIRQALAYAIDRQRMVDTVMQGLTHPETLPWAASSPAYDAAKNQTYAFDLQRAKSLLDAAGASDLAFDLFYTTARPEHVTMATIFQGDLAQIGVNATLKSADLASYFAQVQAVSYKGMAVGSGVSSQLLPQTLLLGVYHSPVVNLSGYKDDTWAKLVDDVSAETDATRRKALYAQINDFLLDQAWNLPVTHSPNRVVSHKNVHGMSFELHEALNFAEVSLG